MKTLPVRKPHQIFSILAVILTATAMINCSLTPALKSVDLTESLENLKSGGGGTGYDGKLAFINIDKENSCGLGASSPVRSVVEIGQDLVPRQVRKNCVDIAPLALNINDIGLMPHNPKNLSVAGQAYDLLSEETEPLGSIQNSTQYFCRGTGKEGDLKETHVADMILTHKLGDSLADSASVIMAVYNEDGGFSRKLETGTLKVRNIETGVPDRLKYVSEYVGKFQVTLWIDKVGETKTGKLTLVELPYAGKQLEPGFQDEDYQRNVQNLVCITH